MGVAIHVCSFGYMGKRACSFCFSCITLRDGHCSTFTYDKRVTPLHYACLSAQCPAHRTACCSGCCSAYCCAHCMLTCSLFYLLLCSHEELDTCVACRMQYCGCSYELVAVMNTMTVDALQVEVIGLRCAPQ